MPSPVDLESKRAVTDFLSMVLVVSISTFNLREVEIHSAAVIVSTFGRVFCHFSFRTFGVKIGSRVMAGDGVPSNFCMSGRGVSESCIFDSISKQL